MENKVTSTVDEKKKKSKNKVIGAIVGGLVVIGAIFGPYAEKENNKKF